MAPRTASSASTAAQSRRSGRSTNNSQSSVLDLQAFLSPPRPQKRKQSRYVDDDDLLPSLTKRRTSIGIYLPATPFSTVHTPAKPTASPAVSTKIRCCNQTFTFALFQQHNAKMHLNAAPTSQMGGLSLIAATVTEVLFTASSTTSRNQTTPINTNADDEDTTSSPTIPPSVIKAIPISFLFQEMEQAVEHESNPSTEIYWTRSPTALETSCMYATTTAKADAPYLPWSEVPAPQSEWADFLQQHSITPLMTPKKGSSFNFETFMNSTSTTDSAFDWGSGGVNSVVDPNHVTKFGHQLTTNETTFDYTTMAASKQAMLQRTPSSKSTASQDAFGSGSSSSGKRSRRKTIIRQSKRSAAKFQKAMAVAAAADALRLTKKQAEDDDMSTFGGHVPMGLYQNESNMIGSSSKSASSQKALDLSARKRPRRGSFTPYEEYDENGDFFDQEEPHYFKIGQSPMIALPTASRSSVNKAVSRRDSVATATPFLDDASPLKPEPVSRLLSLTHAEPATDEELESHAGHLDALLKDVTEAQQPDASSSALGGTGEGMMDYVMMMLGGSGANESGDVGGPSSSTNEEWRNMLKFDGLDENLEVGSASGLTAASSLDSVQMHEFMNGVDPLSGMLGWEQGLWTDQFLSMDTHAILGTTGSIDVSCGMREPGHLMDIMDTNIGDGEIEDALVSASEPGCSVQQAELVGGGGKRVFTCTYPSCAKVYASKTGLKYHLGVHKREEKSRSKKKQQS
ncbi:hypothetical protein HDU79_007861 [Rhizoclosmatium sp. JEL0117]|nr:hypothetical protein HDU79_007861 [Rhizoclosmatium sp. JEL0117]